MSYLQDMRAPNFTLAGDPAESLVRIAYIHPVRLIYALQAFSEKTRNPKEFIEELPYEEAGDRKLSR